MQCNGSGRGRRTRQAFGLMPDDLGRIETGDLGAIIQHNAGRGGIGAVHDDLQRRGFARLHVGAKAVVDLQHRLDLAAVHQFPYFLFRLDPCGDGEIAGMHKPSHQFPARHGVVEVADRGPHVFDVGGDGIAKHQQLDDGHQKDDAGHFGIPEDLPELFVQHVDNSL